MDPSQRTRERLSKSAKRFPPTMRPTSKCTQSIACSCSRFSQPNTQIACTSLWVDEAAVFPLPPLLFIRRSTSPCLSLRNVAASRESHSLVSAELCVVYVFLGAKCTTHHSSTTEKSKRKMPLYCHACHAPWKMHSEGTKMNLDALFGSLYGKKPRKGPTAQ